MPHSRESIPHMASTSLDRSSCGTEPSPLLQDAPFSQLSCGKLAEASAAVEQSSRSGASAVAGDTLLQLDCCTSCDSNNDKGTSSWRLSTASRGDHKQYQTNTCRSAISHHLNCCSLADAHVQKHANLDYRIAYKTASQTYASKDAGKPDLPPRQWPMRVQGLSDVAHTSASRVIDAVRAMRCELPLYRLRAIRSSTPSSEAYCLWRIVPTLRLIAAAATDSTASATCSAQDCRL